MPPWNGLFSRLRPKEYGRRPPLVLLNGLAEQAESWFKNRRFWDGYFEVHVPNIIVYDGPMIAERVKEGKPVSVDYLVEQLHVYVTRFVQAGPVHLVSSSLGGKVAVEFAARHPGLVNRMVLLCPAGMGDEERLPVIEGVVKNDWHGVVKSVFFRPRFVDKDIVRYYKAAVNNRKWKAGVLRTVNGTKDTTVRARMKDVQAPTLLVTGKQDKICCPATAEEAARDLLNGHFLALPKCGHAPQIEKSRKINRLVVHFLTAPDPSAKPGWLLPASPTTPS
jgi:pimeloyl-ACP methyl ester carboxylesterase